MITLLQFPSLFGLPNSSPFCMKVENYLRMAGIDYENTFVIDPRKSPKGKLPCIKMDGQLVADSEIILQRLKQKFGDILDKNLNEQQKALSVILTQMFCDHLYWFIVYMRWQEEDGWKIVKPTYFAKISPLIRGVIANIIRKATIKQLHAQGLGRHSRTEVVEMGYNTLNAIAEILGDNRFFMGDEPTTVDATAFAFLANFLWTPLNDPLSLWVRNNAAITAYCKRMWVLFYPELPIPE